MLLIWGLPKVLRQHGAQDGFLLDGGHSTTMVLGPKAAHVRPGTLLGGSRPVATCFGSLTKLPAETGTTSGSANGFHVADVLF